MALVRAHEATSIMLRQPLLHGRITDSIIGAYYEVYKRLRGGGAEHLCKKALEIELRARGHVVQREVAVLVYYKGHEIGTQRLHMLVDGKVVVEVKSTMELHPAARDQLFNYLRVTGLQVGLLLHFGRKPSFHRVIWTYTEQSAESVPSVKSATPIVVPASPSGSSRESGR